jgi:hypothetical protein
MRVEVALERLTQLRDLLAHLPAREIRQHLRVGRAGDERVEHVAPRLADDVRRDAIRA